MPRFVLLRHECPSFSAKESHWDFLLETGATLAAWNLYELPVAWREALSISSATLPHETHLGKSLSNKSLPGEFVAAERIADHRLEYLEYEGEVSRSRGEVTCIDRGEFSLLTADDQRWRLTLAGESLSGEVLLERQTGERWRLCWLG